MDRRRPRRSEASEGLARVTLIGHAGGRARSSHLALVVLLSLCSLSACAGAPGQDRPKITEVPSDAEQFYFAIEIDGTLSGYAHLATYPTEIDGRPATVLRQRTFLLMSMLGAEVDTEIDQTFHLDPATEMYFYSRADARQGPSSFRWEAVIEDGAARVSSTLGGREARIELPPDIVLADTLHQPHLKRDFVERDLETATHPVLDVRDAEVRDVVYRRLRGETLELAGETYETVVVEEHHPKIAAKLTLWIDRATGYVVQVDVPGGRRIYRSEPKVIRKIEVANLDEKIISKVGVLISDFQSITYLKVRGVFQPTGLRLTPEDLNVPGQSFAGTIERNRVEGVFEIRHARYDGSEAPPFPPDFKSDEALREYLLPAELVESDDPVLVAKARELTAGATDSWDATRRLTTWVAENIDYAIPGGGTARRTYDLRAGECGAHSALVTAFCRAVGVPARIVWGCQYVPGYGGAFGQHGWNEVYMGEAVGWVPVDATSYEPDYVDSGHVRIGDHQSAATALNPIEMEILEYALDWGEVIVPGAKDAPAAETVVDAGAARYGAYLGSYTGPRGRVFEVRVDNDALVIDVEGQTLLPMKDPDPDGVWWFKTAPKLYVTFDRDEKGEVTRMWMHELVRMRKTAEPERIDADTPERLRGHLGTYLLAAANTEFVVAWRRGSLAIREADVRGFTRLEEDAASPGTWISQTTGNRITFRIDADGSVEELVLDSGRALERN